MQESSWEIHIHRYKYQNHAASKLYRDMETLGKDMTVNSRVRNLTEVCKVFLTTGEYIGFVVQDMYTKYGMNDYFLLSQWNKWIEEIQRNVWAEDARLYFDRKKRDIARGYIPAEETPYETN